MSARLGVIATTPGDLEDLIQEGTIGLIRTVDHLDSSWGLRFSIDATWWIRAGIGNALEAKGCTIQLPSTRADQLQRQCKNQQSLSQELGSHSSLEQRAEVTGLKPLDIREILFRAQQTLSLDAAWSPLEDDSLMERIRCGAPRPDELLSNHLLSSDLQLLLQELPEQEAELLRLRYGINGQEPMNLSAVARSLSVTRDTARGIERRVVAAIRNRAAKVIDDLDA